MAASPTLAAIGVLAGLLAVFIILTGLALAGVISLKPSTPRLVTQESPAAFKAQIPLSLAQEEDPLQCFRCYHKGVKAPVTPAQ